MLFNFPPLFQHCVLPLNTLLIYLYTIVFFSLWFLWLLGYQEIWPCWLIGGKKKWARTKWICYFVFFFVHPTISWSDNECCVMDVNSFAFVWYFCVSSLLYILSFYLFIFYLFHPLNSHLVFYLSLYFIFIIFYISFIYLLNWVLLLDFYKSKC